MSYRPSTERERAVFNALDDAWRRLDHIQRRTKPGDGLYELAVGAEADVKQALGRLGLLDYAYERLQATP